jgi:hypothetical protein
MNSLYEDVASNGQNFFLKFIIAHTQSIEDFLLNLRSRQREDTN